MFRRFISYYRPHRLVFTLDMLASLFVSLIGILYPIVTRTMLNSYIPDRNVKMIVIAGVGLLLLYVVRMFLNFFIQYEGHMMGVRMQAQMRRDMFAHLEQLPYTFYDDHETGKIMSRLTNDLMDVSELAHHGPENIIISTVSIVLSFIYLATINLFLTLIIFLCVPLLFAVSLTLRRKMRDAFKKSRAAIAEINAAAESSISGIRVSKAFNNADKEQEKFEQGNKNFINARRAAYRAMGMFHSSTSFITSVFNIVVLIAGGIFMYNGVINFADYAAFFAAINLFITPVTTLINFMEQFQDGVTGFERFTEILDTPAEPDAPDAADLGVAGGEIEIRDLSFAYNERKPVLDHLSLRIPKGTTFALVGPSGGGKTTICHLLPHFYDYTDGEIFIDGKELHTLTNVSIRRNIGIVQQDVYLFNASIKDNILYGRPDATDEEVIAAAKRANIHDFVLSLPDGYDSQIGERGVRLSGGQKQRLSIARVFLKNPPILILDEATSALDNTTEILIEEALDELCVGRTTLVVAHRLSTVKNADKIAVIAQGRVIEQGSHDELMAKDGAYAALYNLQFREEPDAPAVP